MKTSDVRIEPSHRQKESNLRGRIFDIQRFALHDGPGIRTTVFLKGCPLDCLWCHNPEAKNHAPEIAFFADKCTLCGDCAAVCPQGAHALLDGMHHFDRSLCLRCGLCTRACTFGALRTTGRDMTVEQVMAEAIRDETYYRESGGGLTLSGGEPMQQFDFTWALLTVARERGIHTCLDTCGLAPRRYFEKILPLVDYFLFDYKATDAAEHKRLTGVSNEPILANLDFLYRRGATIRLRCPLIPDVNDSREHLQGIAMLAKKYPELDGVEIMPYHDIAGQKYQRYGYRDPLPGVPAVDEDIRRNWLRQLHRLGVRKVFMEETDKRIHEIF